MRLFTATNVTRLNEFVIEFTHLFVTALDDG
jgi:hypothetical protein